MTNMQNEKMNEMIQSNNEFQQKIVIALNNSLKDMQESNERKLDKIESTVNEKLDKTLNARLDSSFKQIGDQLSELYKSLGELNKLSTGVTDLNRTLSNVKTRGTWGEIQLQAILEQTMVRSQYDINIPTKKNSNDRIEFAIKIPTKDDSDEFIYLPIDSKMPTDIYNKIMTASENADPVLLSSATKELEQRIKTEARTIRDKYIDPPNTTDFAIMFLPTESLYAEVLRINGLMEWCQINCKIVISGPSTITALLNSLRLGFSNMALNKKSKDVLKLLQAIKTQYVTLSGLIDKTQKKLHDATVATEALKTRTDMIQKRMIKIEELELQDANEFLGLPEPEDD
jgi:DNA recombination protein RmuC